MQYRILNALGHVVGSLLPSVDGLWRLILPSGEARLSFNAAQFRIDGQGLTLVQFDPSID